tara:strand:- start:26548 stop:27132 length:585 start_codon:yes stop_codon:yes gene_type:complete
MNWLYWILEFTQTAVWPITILILAYTFREEIAVLLKRLTTLKVAGVEATFMSALRDIDAVMERTRPRYSLPREDLQADIPMFQRRVDESENLMRFAESFPSAAILESWNRIEIILREKAASRGVDRADVKGIPVLLSDLFAGETEAMSLYMPIRELELLRNMASHSSQPVVSAESAREYVKVARDVLNRINTEL